MDQKEEVSKKASTKASLDSFPGSGLWIPTFELHTAILEPDLDLPFCQFKLFGDLDSPSACQIPIRMELLLEL